MKTICRALLFTLLAGSAANAQVSFGASGGNTTVTLASNINFTATGGPDFFTRFVFEGAYSLPPGTGGFNTISNSIGLLVNGNPMVGYGTGSLWGPLNFNLGLISGNDFTISFTNASGYTAGDIVTLTAGTAVTNTPISMMPDLAPTGVTMTGNNGDALSATVDLNVVATPEPSSILLSATGLMFLAGFARRRNSARAA